MEKTKIENNKNQNKTITHETFQNKRTTNRKIKIIPEIVKNETSQNKSSSQKKEPVIFPQQFKFNPKDPSFKHKGLKQQKKKKDKLSTTNEINTDETK